MSTSEYPLTHPVYTRGSCSDHTRAISKIKEMHDLYGSGKYVNFVGMPLDDLPIVQEAFPEYVIVNTGSIHSPYYEVRSVVK